MVIVCFFLFWQVAPTGLDSALRAVEAHEYGDAVDILDGILLSDSTDVTARYLRAIALREQGRNPTLFNRIQRFLSRSERDFEFILTQDSSFQDILLQYGILKRYRNDLQRAIKLGEAQLNYRPDLDHTLPTLLSFYWRYIVTHDSEEARQWLRGQSGVLAPLFLGRTYERQGMFSAAEQIYNTSDVLLTTITLLARARLEFARVQWEAGTRAVEEAVSSLDSRVDALVLFEDIKMIASPTEVAMFEEIYDPAEYQDYFNVFWNRRNPMPAAPYNARMVEHYRRLRIAEQDYLFNGFRSWFRSEFTSLESYFPPTYLLSSDYTDRGIIFLRHGEPDDYTMGESNSWLYHDSLMVFHFAPTCIAQICGITDHFVPSPRGPTFASSIVGLDELDAERISAKYLMDGLSTDRHRWPTDTRSWSVPYVLGAFRGMEGQTLVEMYYQIPMHESRLSSELDSTDVEAGLAAHSMDWKRVHFIREHHTSPQQASSLNGLFQMDLIQDSVHVAFHAREVGGVHLHASRFTYAVPEFTEIGLQMSDILLADSLDALPDASSREDLILYVNPSGEFAQPAVPLIYYEIYNLSQAPDGQTRYEVSYSLISDESAAQPGAITLQTSEQRGIDESPIVYLSMDMGEANFGSYTLEVHVEDLITGTAVSSTRELTLSRKE